MSVFLIDSKQPLHLQVARRLKQMIARQYAPGDMLPTYRELTKHFGVGMVTLKRAMDILADQGIVTPIRSRGTVVNRQLTAGETELSQVALVVAQPIGALFTAEHLSAIVGSLCDQADEMGANLRLYSLSRPNSPISPEQLNRSGADGVALLNVRTQADLIPLADLDIPMVVLDHRSLGVPLDYVACDDPAATDVIVRHLASLGHRRITFSGSILPDAPTPHDSAGNERMQSFLDAMARGGLTVCRPFHRTSSEGGAWGRSAAQAIANAVSRGGPNADGPTAVVTDSARDARGLIAELRRAGLRVPADISVASIAATRRKTAAVPLTCCHVHFHDMGAKGMDILKLRNRTPRPSEPVVHRVGFKFTVGVTTAPPRR